MELSISLEHKSSWKLSVRKKMPYSIDDINVFPPPFFSNINIQRTKDKRTETPKGNEGKLLPKIKSQKTYPSHLHLNLSYHKIPPRPPNVRDLPSSRPLSQISWPLPQFKGTSIFSLVPKEQPVKQSPKQTETS